MGAGRLGSIGPFGAAGKWFVAGHEPLVVVAPVAPPRSASATELRTALHVAPLPLPCCNFWL